MARGSRRGPRRRTARRRSRAHSASTARLPRTRPIPPGSGRQPGCCSRGVGHSTARPANDATSTIAAAQPNSHSGIGSVVRWTSPCASAACGRERDGGRHPGQDGEPRAAAHSAVFSACSNASRPNEPSSRAVIFPSLPTTNSHGSVGRLNSCSGLRRPLFGVVVRVDLLVDELHLVAVARAQLQPDVDDRAADARLAQLRRREQERDRLLADARRRSSRACRSSGGACRSPRRHRPRRRRCRSSTFGAGSPTSGTLSSRGGDHLELARARRPACRRRASPPSPSTGRAWRTAPARRRRRRTGRPPSPPAGSGTAPRSSSTSAGATNGPLAGDPGVARRTARSCRRRSRPGRRSRRTRRGSAARRGRPSRRGPSAGRRRSRRPAPAASCRRAWGTRTAAGPAPRAPCPAGRLGTCATGSFAGSSRVAAAAAGGSENQRGERRRERGGAHG